MTFTDTALAYEVAVRATATRETVDEPYVRRLALAVRRLSQSISEFEDDQLLLPMIRRLRRSLRELGSTPLSPGSQVFALGASVKYLSSLVGQARDNYPDSLIARADLCVEALTGLSDQTANPFGDLVAEILSTGDPERSALLVKTRYMEEVAYWLKRAAPGTLLVDATKAARLTGIDTLVAAGPSYCFPPHVVTAPRAETICFVHYKVFRDRERSSHVFGGLYGTPGAVIRAAHLSVPSGDDQIEPEFLAASVDWDALERASGRHRRSAHDVEAVRANLFLLADGHAVYLEADDGPTVELVDGLEPGSTPRLRSEQTRSIRPGNYIVLRSEGGSGDYIPGVADSLLGKRASHLRLEQMRWKQALGEKIRERGIERVEQDLRALGISSPNLRYRLWRNSIRSRKPNDFRILMKYVGLGGAGVPKRGCWKGSISP